MRRRTDGQTTTSSLSGFWSGQGGITFSTPTGAFDPRVLYDASAGGHWIITCGGDVPRSGYATNTGSILVAVSQTNDPTGNWYRYQVFVSAKYPKTSDWIDHPATGFNLNWIVVAGNVFDYGDTTNNPGRGSIIYVFDKAKLYSGVQAVTTKVDSSSYNYVPAVTYDNTNPGTYYLMQDWNGNSSGKSSLHISTVAGSVGNETFTPGAAIASSSYTYDSVPSSAPAGADINFAPQLGSSVRIHLGDSLIQNCVYRNGSLWCTYTVFLPAGGSPTRSSILWWQVTPGGTPQQVGLIDDPTGNKFYAYPSIAVNKSNAVLIGYSRFSSSQYASAYYSYRNANDPPSTLRADVALKLGETTYSKQDDYGRNRWGDYSSTVVDPANDTDMWTLQEYASTVDAYGSYSANHWGTWWGQIPLPVGPATSVATSSDGKFHVLWNNPDGSVELWTINTQYVLESSFAYGPYPGYSAKMIAAGPDNHVHILWNRTDGLLSLWDVDTLGNFSFVNYGPFSGYTASAIAVGGNNQVRVLWNNTSGSISLWNIDGSSPSAYSFTNYGPFSGYSAKSLSVGPNSKPRILWNNTNGSISLWNVDGSQPSGYSYANYGPFSGYNATAIGVDNNNFVRLLWRYTDNSISVWTLDGTTAAGYSYHNYGPYSGWTANAVSVGTDNYLHILWNKTDGTASLWSVNGNYDFAHGEYGPF